MVIYAILCRKPDLILLNWFFQSNPIPSTIGFIGTYETPSWVTIHKLLPWNGTLIVDILVMLVTSVSSESQALTTENSWGFLIGTFSPSLFKNPSQFCELHYLKIFHFSHCLTKSISFSGHLKLSCGSFSAPFHFSSPL